MTAPLMDKTDLARRLKVPPTWVRDAITARRIPITWVGRHARFTEADFEAILAAGHEEPIRPSAVIAFEPRRNSTPRRVA